MNRKIKPIIFSLAASFLLTAFDQVIETDKSGKEIFESNCVRCHGNDGTRGKWGAKNLQKSKLADVALLYIISNGKRAMPSWKYSLSTGEIDRVKDYIKELRK